MYPFRRRPNSGTRKPRFYRPACEALEERRLLSIVLDPIFGTQGVVSNTISDLVVRSAFVAPATDGKIVIAGSVSRERLNLFDFPIPNYYVRRLNADGSADTSFGAGGQVSGDGDAGGCTGLAVQADGKIIIATDRSTVRRLTPGGELDPSFGSGGTQNTPWVPVAVALQADGKLLVAGQAEIRGGDFGIARCTSTGQLDSTFAFGGTVITDFSTSPTLFSSDKPRAIIVQADGRIVVVGSALTQVNGLSDPNQLAMARYTESGQLDTSFNGTGKLVDATAIVTTQTEAKVIQQADGKLVVAASASTDMSDVEPRLLLARYNRDGSADTGFATAGKLVLPNVDVLDPRLALLPDQTLVVTASALLGFNNSGTNLSTFLAGGDVPTVWEVAALPEGKLVAVQATGGKTVVTRFAPSSGLILVTGADAGGGPDVRVYDATNRQFLYNFFAFDSKFTGGVRVATGDVNADGTPDIIVGPGPGGGPQVRVFDGHAGAPLAGPLSAFFAFDQNFTGGVFVASGDVNADGFADVIVSADAGGGPSVTVYSGKDAAVLRAFFAYDQNFTGGVRVASADVNGDGHADIVCGAGPGGGPNVTIFSGNGFDRLYSFFAYAVQFTAGIYVAAGDINGNGKAEAITGAGPGGGPNVAVFDVANNAQLLSFFPYAPEFTGGVRVAALSSTSRGHAVVASVPGPGGGPDVRIANGKNGAQVDEFFAYDPKFSGGLYVAGTAH